MRPGRVARTVLIAGLCVLGLKELADLALPPLADSMIPPIASPSAEPPTSFSESLPEQDLALALVRPGDVALDQWVRQVSQPLTRDEIKARLQDLSATGCWIGEHGGPVMALLVPPYARGDDFVPAGVEDADLSSSLAWLAANDAGWHVFLIDQEIHRITAHVMVPVTLDTPYEVFVLVTKEPYAK